MPISENQLQTWSKLGPTQQFTNTYDTIKAVLEDPNSPFAKKDYTVFLQGSYRNKTNIYADSDVDIIIRLNRVNAFDPSLLPFDDRQKWEAAGYRAEQSLDEFKKEVISWLYKKFNLSISVGSKAIKVTGAGARRDADVLVCAIARKFLRFKGNHDKIFDDGICFKDIRGNTIINFPEQHMTNCSKKHQDSNMWFKHTVRIYKNLRNKLIANGLVNDGLAPSYFIEGLLYNVPIYEFGGNETSNFISTLNWLNKNDKTKYLCANEHYLLCHDTSPVTWRIKSCEQFLNAVTQFYLNS